MTNAVEGSPRALLSRFALAETGRDKRMSAQTDEAIASVNAMALSRFDLEGQNDRLKQDLMSLQAELQSVTQRNETLTRKLAETHEVIASLSNEAKQNKAQFSEAIARAKLAEEELELAHADLERLLAAVKASSTGQSRTTAHVRLVG